MNKYLFIRADGNEKIGIGHIMRSMTIANAFRKAGYKCIYISSKPINREVFDRYKYDVIEIDYPYDSKSIAEAHDVLNIMKKYGNGHLLVDSYYVNNDYLGVLKQGTNVVCINSTRDRLNLNYLINENIACDREYIEQLYSGTGTKLLLGSDYTPIRDEFINNNYEVRRKVNRIIVTTGGGDQYNFMTELTKRIKADRRYESIEFTMISGGCNIYYEDLVKEANSANNITVISNPANMAELMLESDLAISAGGSTILELSVLGVPSIGFSVAEDQKAGLFFMDKIEMVKYAGHITDERFWEVILTELNNAIEDYSSRMNLSNKSRKCFDGKGAERIFLEITGEK